MIYLFKFILERLPLKLQAVMLAIYFISGMSLIKKRKNRKRILVFSYLRWQDDLKKLVDLSPYNFIAINQRRLEMINSYVLKINEKYNINFLSLIIKVIYKIRKFDLCLTCNVAYNSEREWIGILEKNAPKMSESSTQKLFNWYFVFTFLIFLIFLNWYKEGRN